MKKNQSLKKILSTTTLTIFILFIIDQLTKYSFTNKSYLFSEYIFFQYSQNFGSAFSFGSNFLHYNTIIILLSFLVLFYLIKFKSEFYETKLKKVSYILLISGILGNLFDRIFFGFVKDFIAVKYFSIFNFADIYLTLAIILFLYSEISQTSKFKL